MFPFYNIFNIVNTACLSEDNIWNCHPLKTIVDRDEQCINGFSQGENFQCLCHPPHPLHAISTYTPQHIVASGNRMNTKPVACDDDHMQQWQTHWNLAKLM